MKNKKLKFISSGVLLLIMMIATDYSAYTTEMALAEYKGEVFDKGFSPMWGSFIVPLIFFVLAFIPNK